MLPNQQREASVYQPEHFRETRIKVLQAFVAQHPLASLVAATGAGLSATHLPLRSELRSAGSGMLRGHIARANSLWRELAPGADVLAIFSGADSYISPNWYPSKQEHGKVVPTWNYATVHVHGTITFTHDTVWLRDFVTELTRIHEQGQPHPWQVSDAPADYIEGMLRAIVGFEITVTRIEAKFKGSQNRSVADRMAVDAALRGAGRSAADVAQIVPK
jgi:transcriptional regulator